MGTCTTVSRKPTPCSRMQPCSSGRESQPAACSSRVSLPKCSHEMLRYIHVCIHGSRTPESMSSPGVHSVFAFSERRRGQDQGERHFLVSFLGSFLFGGFPLKLVSVGDHLAVSPLRWANFRALQGKQAILLPEYCEKMIPGGSSVNLSSSHGNSPKI